MQSEASALVTLWDDASPDVESEVRRRLKSRGRSILPALHRLRLSACDEQRLRAADIAHWLHLQTFMPLWAHEVQKPNLDLERALLLLSLFRSPLLDLRQCREKIDRMAHTCPVQPSSAMTTETAITIVDHFLETLTFRYTDHQSDPDALCLNTAIEKRRGHPLLLGCLFLLIARQLSLPFSLSITSAGRYLLFPLDARLLLFDIDDMFKLTDHAEWSLQERISGRSKRPIAPPATPDHTLLVLVLREMHARTQRLGDHRTASELEDLLTLAEPVQR